MLDGRCCNKFSINGVVVVRNKNGGRALYRETKDNERRENDMERDVRDGSRDSVCRGAYGGVLVFFE